MAKVFKLEVLDIEAFKLIDDELARKFEGGRQFFREQCTEIAIRKRDIKFLVDANLFSMYSSSVFNIALAEATKGNLTILDWIFKAKLEFPVGYTWTSSARFCSLSYVPLLKYLSKRLPPCEFLTQYATEHFSQANKSGDGVHYGQVIATRVLLGQ